MEKGNRTIQSILKEDVKLSDVMNNLKEREKAFQDEMTWRERGRKIKALFPEIYENQIKKAEMNLSGYAKLPGSPDPHFIGNPVRWRENIYDYDEYSYQLNRMDHWRTMAEAYSFTGDERYAQKLIEEFYSWIEECPRQPLYDDKGNLAVESFDGCVSNQGIWRSLEVGIRMYRTWPHLIHHLLNSGYIDEKFLETYLLSCYQHCEVLYKVPPIIWPDADHNHYLMENNGLLYFSCMFPEVKDAEMWKNHAIREMERSIRAQVTEDGGQIEGCASYHNGSVYWFVLPLLLAKKYGFTLSEEYSERLKKMVHYSIYATRPSGGNSCWGDSHTISGTLTAGAFAHYLAFGDSRYLKNALYYYTPADMVRLNSEHIWEVEDLDHLYSCLANAKKERCQPDLPLLSWQHELKQTFFRTGWDHDALSVMFACRTPIKNLHEHIDPAGFEFTAYGRNLLGDPSVYTYKNDENRKKAKSAHWHNCLTLNHENPWEYISSWAYGKQEEGGILNAEQTDRMSYAIAYHMNYKPTMHKRAVALLDSRLLVVLDYLDQVPEGTSLQINFHMDCPCAVADSERSFAESLADEGANIAVYSDPRLKPNLVPAKISVVDYSWHDTMIARFEAEYLEQGNHAFLSVGVPAREGEKPAPVDKIGSHIISRDEIEYTFIFESTCYKIIMRGEKLEVESAPASKTDLKTPQAKTF